MGLVELLVGVISVLCVGVGVSLALANPTPGELLVARACFIGASLAIIAAYFYWIYREESVSIWSRIVIGLTVGCITFVVLPEALRWTQGKETKIAQTPVDQKKHPNTEAHTPNPAPQPDPPTISFPNNNGVVSINQTGGQTAHTIVNQAPEPKLKTLSEKTEANEDGTYTHILVAEVVAPYTPGQMQIKAISPDIMALEVRPNRSGISMNGSSGNRPGYSFATVMSPFGQYTITVQTRTNATIGLEYTFSK
jgi:hypothetical protein